MTKEEFKAFCKEEFYKRGFKKVKNMYYLDGEKDILCGIDLQKSNFGKVYYINVNFFIKGFNEKFPYPTCYDADIDGRMSVMSKTETYQGKTFMTSQIRYEEYTSTELREYFEKDFESWILPSVKEGTIFLAKKIDYMNLSPSFLAKEEDVLKLLKLRKQDICGTDLKN